MANDKMVDYTARVPALAGGRLGAPAAPGASRPPEGGTPAVRLAGALASLFALTATAHAQVPNVRYGEVVPRDVREMYDRGLQYMASTQTEAGNWTGGDVGPGATGLGLMVFLASGEDPN